MARQSRLIVNQQFYLISAVSDFNRLLFSDNADYESFLTSFSDVTKRFPWKCVSFCLYQNYYFLLVFIDDSSLTKGVRYLNGKYTQYYNEKYQTQGNLFNGRFKSRIVEPTHVSLVNDFLIQFPTKKDPTINLDNWYWSSYQPLFNLSWSPKWFDKKLLDSFYSDLTKERYHQNLVTVDESDLKKHTINQQVIGSDSFFNECMNHKVEFKNLVKPELTEFTVNQSGAHDAMVAAYKSGLYSMDEIAAFFNVHASTVSRKITKQMSA